VELTATGTLASPQCPHVGPPVLRPVVVPAFGAALFRAHDAEADIAFEVQFPNSVERHAARFIGAEIPLHDAPVDHSLHCQPPACGHVLVFAERAIACCLRLADVPLAAAGILSFVPFATMSAGSTLGRIFLPFVVWLAIFSRSDFRLPVAASGKGLALTICESAWVVAHSTGRAVHELADILAVHIDAILHRLALLPFVFFELAVAARELAFALRSAFVAGCAEIVAFLVAFTDAVSALRFTGTAGRRVVAGIRRRVPAGITVRIARRIPCTVSR